MTVVRLALTAAAMAGIGCTLGVLAPDPVAAVGTLRHAHGTAALGSAEPFVLALTGCLAWLVWAWGAVGLLLTGASGLPGLPGAVARLGAALLVPERVRAAAALALGVGIAVAAPVAAAPSPPGPPDWPTTATGPPAATDPPAAPDRSADPRPGAPGTASRQHVVVLGDCLWSIAADQLASSGRHPTDARTAQAVSAWFAANVDVIGADPDLIHPGQVLQAPRSGPDPAGGAR